jgi:hypothetical protein
VTRPHGATPKSPKWVFHCGLFKVNKAKQLSTATDQMYYATRVVHDEKDCACLSAMRMGQGPRRRVRKVALCTIFLVREALSFLDTGQLEDDCDPVGVPNISYRLECHYSTKHRSAYVCLLARQSLHCTIAEVSTTTKGGARLRKSVYLGQ